MSEPADLLQDSCGNPKLSRCGADDPLKERGKMALVREASADRYLGQTELAVCLQELLRPFNAAVDQRDLGS